MGIPTPVSDTDARTQLPGVISGIGGSAFEVTLIKERSNCNRPPSGMASRALTAKFIKTCCKRVGSAETIYDSFSYRKSTRIVSGRVRLSSFSISFRKGTKSSVLCSITERRLKSKICRIRLAARWTCCWMISKRSWLVVDMLLSIRSKSA